MNVAELLTRQATLRPDAPAVVRGAESWSFGQLDAMVWGLCRHLHARGVRPGDVVGLHVVDPLVHLTANWSLARMGGTAVAIHPPRGANPEALELLRRTSAKAVLDDRTDAAWPGLATLTMSPESARALGHSGGTPLPELAVGEPTAALHFKTSSGTTGRPKIVAASHAGMLASIAREIEVIGYPAGEAYMTPVSLALDGPRRRSMACLASGGVLVLPPARADAAAWIEHIERHDVRHFSCVASQAYAMAQSRPPGSARLSHLRCFRLSAGPSDASLHRLIRERLTEHVLVSYGCTEVGPMTVADPALLADEPRTVGHPMPGIEVQIVTADGGPVEAGQVGHVRIRAGGMPVEYLDDAEATARAFRDGWFHPGDLGRLDERGRLFHLGRADAMMVSDGVNIYPAEIEQALLSHPAVRDAVALPLPHPVVHDVPIGVVALLEPGACTEAQLLEHTRMRLGARSPRRVAIVPAIARSDHGKVDRDAIRRAALAALGLVPDGGGEPPRQLVRRLRATFTTPPQPPTGQVEHWLTAVLGASPLQPSQAPPLDAADWARRWLLVVLQVTRWLLQGARLPCFDSPQVGTCHADPEHPGHWSAAIGLPHVEHVPDATYAAAFRTGVELGARFVAQPLDDDGLGAFFDEAEARFVAPLTRQLGFGKSTLPVLRVAHAQSIPFSHLGAGVFQLGWGADLQRLDRSATDRDSVVGARLCGQKALTAAVLRSAGLPAPRHALVTTADGALAAARQLGWPLVVKPNDGERGEGVTVDAIDDDRLRLAVAAALKASRQSTVLVERQVPGICHRLFITRGRLLYAVKRWPMSVHGDGVRTVATLVDDELARQRRRPPWERSGIEPLDAEAHAMLQAAGLTPESIPPAGARVVLRRVESTATGGVDEDVSTVIHPENLRVALHAAEVLGLETAGVDLITTDVSRPWHDTGAVINEVNFAPLLGGAAISLSHVPRFLHDLVGGSGRIPVEVFVGGDAAWQQAAERHQALRGRGIGAFISSGRTTVDAQGRPWPLPLDGLRARARALVMSRRVQWLVLVVHDDELLARGLPLESISALTRVDMSLRSMTDTEQPLTPERARAVLAQLEAWARHPAAEGSDRAAN